MEFLDISSLGATYRYVVKIEQKFKQQNKREFGSANPQQPKYGKGNPNSQNNQPQDNQSKPQENKGNKKMKKDTGKWCDFHKIPWHNTDECRSKQSLVVELKENKSRALTWNLIQKIIKGDRSLMQNPLLPSRPQQSNQKNQRILRRGSASSIHKCG
jgi:hypothetical protein